MILILRRSSDQDRALKQYLDDLQNPASPSFHKWLTPGQFGASFGISDNDLASVTSWIQTKGFKVEKVSLARNRVEFSGTFGQVQDAFHTSIHTFSIDGVRHFANATDPQIPSALAAVIAGVGPLNDFHARPALVHGPRGRYDPSTNRIAPELTLSGGNNLYYLFVDPADAATIYDTPNKQLNLAYSGTSYDGAGISIGIVGVSDLTTADVANYRTAFLGESSGSVNLPTMIVDGNDPGLNGAGTEALLDTEVAGGIAPKAKIFFYTSADTDISSGLMNALFRALDDNAVSILSMSFENCEAALGTSGNQLILEASEQAAAQGITLTVSSGDNGSAGCDNFDTQAQASLGFGVNGLASTPYMVAVGGTDFDVLSASFPTYVNNTTSGTAPYYATALKYIPENPWNDSTTVNTAYTNNVPLKNSQGSGNIIAGGGGVSSVYTKPPFQSSLTLQDGSRDLPDVSFLAGNGLYNAAWVLCSDSQTDGSSQNYVDCQTTNGQFTDNTVFGGIGGTSAAAPAFAGMLALVAQAHGSASDNYRLGQADNVLYQLAQSKYSTTFHDVTAGNNSVPCTAGSADCGSNGFLTGYNAGQKYDLASGLGSVDVAALVSNWASVALSSTITTLSLDGSSTAYSGIHGASITFNAGVTSSATSPTGNIAILDTANETSGGTSSGPQNNGQFVIPVINGVGSAVYNGLPGGSYTVEARYGGDASNAASTSSPFSVTISPEPSTTVLQVNAYDPSTGARLGLANIPYGSEIIADAQIEGTAEGLKTQGLATGTVTFSAGIPTLGTAVVGSENTASLPLFGTKSVPLSAGSQTVVASYSGDASYGSSNSAGVTVTLTKASTSTAITGYPATVTAPQPWGLGVNTTFLVPSAFGQPDSSPSFTVSVNGTTLGPFLEGGDITYSGPAGTGNPVFVTSVAVGAQYLQQGQNVISVTYTGSTNYSSSSSASVNINYTVGVGSFALTNGGNISIAPGASGQSSLALTPSGGFLGQVNFACSVSGAPAGVTCSASPITVTGTGATNTTLFVNTTSSTPAGSYSIPVTASDYGTGKITATTTVALTVAPAAPLGLSLSSSGDISVFPGATTGNTSVITVAPVNGFTGGVNLSCSLTSSPGGASDSPTCSMPASVNIAGSTAATATLTVITTAPTSASLERPLGKSLFAGSGSILALIIFLGVPARRRALHVLLTLVAVLVLTSSMIACGGGGGSGGGGGGQSNPGTTPGSYTFTVKAADAATGQITASSVVTVKVN